MLSKHSFLLIKLTSFALIFTCTAALIMNSLFLVPKSVPVSDQSVTDASNEITVIIDAGHGGEDGGAKSADGLLEKDVNLDIAKDLDLMLRSAGIKTLMTRDDDTMLYDKDSNYQGHKKSLDLAARVKITNETKNAILISIHSNSFPISKYSGLQVYYSQNDERSFPLAKMIQDDVQKFLQQDNGRKIKAASSNIYLLDNAQNPAVLVECGFLSNPDEAAMLATSEYRQKLAFSIFCSVIKYIDSEHVSEL